MGMKQVYVCDRCAKECDSAKVEGWIKVGDLDILAKRSPTTSDAYSKRNIDSEIFCSIECLVNEIGPTANSES